ncbi:MAG: extracellular solute-binding protein [Clostridia bacterium]|nr:extracellular solute-binding protein [Clostridia bacterium]
MRIFKKCLVLCLCALMLITVFTGCHGSVGQAAFLIPEEFDTSRDYEIAFWAKNDTNVTQVHIYEKAIEDFQKLYPNIRVNLRLYTDYGKIYNDVITNIATNTTPNVCITYPDHIATYMTGVNSVVSLDDLLTDEKYGLGGSEVKFDAPKKEEIVPKFMEECYINDVCYAVPYMRSTEACYVNKTYVEKLGYTLPETLTWDFIWEVSEAAAKWDEEGNNIVNGKKVMIPFIYKSTDNMMITTLRQKGAGYSTEEGGVELFNDETRALLKEIASHTESEAFSTFKISGYPANFLNAGQCIFAIDSTAGSTWMGSEAPLVDIAKEELVDFETAVMTVPQYDPENPVMISQGPSMCVFNKEDPQEVLASWLFTQYMLTNEVQIAYAQTEGYAPVTLKAQESAEYKDYMSRGGEDNDFYYDIKIQATKLLMDNTENTFVTPVFNGSASLRDAAGHLVETVTKSTRRHKVVDDAFLDTLFEETVSLYRLDQTRTMSGGGKAELGPLPATSVVLLVSLGGVWVVLALWALLSKKRKK